MRRRRNYLTMTETAILRVLQRQDGEPMSREALVCAVWGNDIGHRTRLYAHITNMRHLAGVPVLRAHGGFYLGALRERVEPSDIEHRLLYPDTFAEIQRVQDIVQRERPSWMDWVEECEGKWLLQAYYEAAKS